MITTLAWKKLIVYVTLTSLFDYLFAFFGVLIVADPLSENFFNYILSWWILITLYLLSVIFIYRNSFCIVKMDEQGIRNKYITINWADAMKYSIITASIGRVPFNAHDDIIVFGSTECNRFTKLNPKNCIFVALTPKVEQYIRFNTQKYLLDDIDSLI